MKDRISAIFPFAAAALLTLGAPAVTFTDWTGLDSIDPTDLATAGNWKGGVVPQLNTSVSPHTGNVAHFVDNDASYLLTLSRDLYINGMNIQCQGSKFDFDLTGRTLRLYGNTTPSQYLFRINDGCRADVLFRNGTFDTSDHYVASGFDAHPYFYGLGTVAFSGTHFPSLTLFDIIHGTSLYLTNGVTGCVHASLTGYEGEHPRLVIAGKKTVIDQQNQSINLGINSKTSTSSELHVLDGATLTNSAVQIGVYGYGAYGIISNATVWAYPNNGRWFGAGITDYASNNVFRIIDSKLDLYKYTGKTQMYSGRFGCRNFVEIAGPSCVVSWNTYDSGAKVLAVGEASDDNLCVVRDGATFGTPASSGGISIAVINYGYIRADANRNVMRVEGGASCRPSTLTIATCCTRTALKEVTSLRRYPDGTTTNKTVTVLPDDDYCYSLVSNRYVTSGAGSSSYINGTAAVAGEVNGLYSDYPAYNVFRVESNAVATCVRDLSVGFRGYANGVEVDGGSTLTIGEWGLGVAVGHPTGSTNSYLRVSNGSTFTALRRKNNDGHIFLLGSGEGGETLLDITGGSTVSANLIATSNANNAVRLVDGSLTTAQPMTFPSDDTAANALRFEIGGTNSCVSAESIAFGEGLTFDFNFTTNGYTGVPFVASQDLSFSAVPKFSFSGLTELGKAGGGTYVLFMAGTSIAGGEAVAAAVEAAVKAVYPWGRANLVGGNTIVLTIPTRRGFRIILR